MVAWIQAHTLLPWMATQPNVSGESRFTSLLPSPGSLVCRHPLPLCPLPLPLLRYGAGRPHPWNLDPRLETTFALCSP